MGASNHYKAQQFIDAIPGTGGVISAIARRVGCDWHTAKKYIDGYPTIERAYDDEVEAVADVAESVLIRNIRLAYDTQKDGQPADSGDAKWYLSRKAKNRGYAERQEIAGVDGNEIVFRVIYGDDGTDDTPPEAAREASGDSGEQGQA